MRVWRLCGVVVEGEEMVREISGVGGAKRMMRCSAGQVMIAGGEDGFNNHYRRFANSILRQGHAYVISSCISRDFLLRRVQLVRIAELRHVRISNTKRDGVHLCQSISSSQLEISA